MSAETAMTIRVSQLPAVIKRRMREASPPIQWTEACKALAACRSIDEAKQWAIIYAHHRMGTIAGEIIVQRAKGTRGRGPGARGVLIASGISPSQASSATAVAKRDLDELLTRSPVPAPQTVRHERFGTRARDPWDEFIKNSHAGIFRAAIRRTSGSVLARSSRQNARSMRSFIENVRGWLDELEQGLK